MKKNSTFTFLLWLIAAIIVFSIILVINNSLYDSITQEDKLVEYIGFLLLLVAGGFTIAAGILGIIEKKRNTWGSLILIFIGLIFFITALEEISWGQRLFGFETPEKLISMNDQNEFNFHNINKKFFDRVLDRLNILFVYFVTLMVFFKKPRFVGIRMPDTNLILAFSIIPFYHQYNQIHFDFYHLLYLPILYIVFRSFVNYWHKDFVAGLLTITLTLLVFWLHSNYNHLFPAHKNSANEIREALFALVCAYYAYVIYDDVKWDRVTFGYY